MDIEKELHILTQQELKQLPEKQLLQIDTTYRQKKNSLIKDIHTNLNTMVQYYRLYHDKIVKIQVQSGVRRYLPDILFANPEMIAEIINDFDKVIYKFPKSMCGAKYFIQKRVYRPIYSKLKEPLQPKIFQVDYIDFNREQLITSSWTSVKLNLKNKHEDALNQFRKDANKFVEYYIKSLQQNASKIDPFDLDLVQNSFICCMDRIKEELHRKLRQCLIILRSFKSHTQFMTVIKNRLNAAQTSKEMLLLKFSMYVDGVYEWTRYYSYNLRRPQDKLQEPLFYTKEGIISSTIKKVVELKNKKQEIQANRFKVQIPIYSQSSQEDSLNSSLSHLSLNCALENEATNIRFNRFYPSDDSQNSNQHSEQKFIKKKIKSNNWQQKVQQFDY